MFNTNLIYETTKVENVQDILNNLGKEWDRQVFCILLTASRSRREVAELGIDVDQTAEKSKMVLQAIQQRKETMLDAAKIVKTALAEQLKNLNEEIATKEQRLESKKSMWAEGQLEDLEEDKLSE